MMYMYFEFTNDSIFWFYKVQRSKNYFQYSLSFSLLLHVTSTIFPGIKGNNSYKKNVKKMYNFRIKTENENGLLS